MIKVARAQHAVVSMGKPENMEDDLYVPFQFYILENINRRRKHTLELYKMYFGT